MDKAVSLKQISGVGYDRNGIIDEILKEFKRLYTVYAKSPSLQFILDEYNGALVHMGHQIKVVNGHTAMTGICRGMDETGALLVQEEGKTDVTRVISGEVSVRGVCGYV